MRFRRVAPVLMTLALGGVPAVARAQELNLRGPHPFLKENALTFQAGYAAGFGDGFSGTRVEGDYLMQARGGLWFDLSMGMVAGSCHTGRVACSLDTGSAADILVGAEWRFQMTVPVIPYTKFALGPVYLFPDRGNDTMAFLLRGAVGAKYYPFDWFGVGAEIAASWGAAAYDLGAYRVNPLGD